MFSEDEALAVGAEAGWGSSVKVMTEVKWLAMKVSSSAVVGRAQPARTPGMTQVKCFKGEVGLLGFGLATAASFSDISVVLKKERLLCD